MPGQGSDGSERCALVRESRCKDLLKLERRNPCSHDKDREQEQREETNLAAGINSRHQPPEQTTKPPSSAYSRWIRSVSRSARRTPSKPGKERPLGKHRPHTEALNLKDITQMGTSPIFRLVMNPKMKNSAVTVINGTSTRAT